MLSMGSVGEDRLCLYSIYDIYGTYKINTEGDSIHLFYISIYSMESAGGSEPVLYHIYVVSGKCKDCWHESMNK